MHVKESLYLFPPHRNLIRKYPSSIFQTSLPPFRAIGKFTTNLHLLGFRIQFAITHSTAHKLLKLYEQEFFFFVSTPFKPGSEDDDEVMSDPKIFFKSTKNRVCNSHWVGGHRYTRILLASKLLSE